MSKKSKKTIVIIIIIMALFFLYGVIRLMHYRNTNPEPICNKGGGFWTIVKNTTCNDLCNASSSGYDCYDRQGQMGCSCGLDKCWDGKNCVER